MPPWLLLLPIVWLVAYRSGRGARRAGAVRHVAGILPHPHLHPPGPMLHGGFQGPFTPHGQGAAFRPWQRLLAERTLAKGATAAHYLQHLNEAAAASRAIDLVKPAALAADVAALMAAPPEVAHAVAVLTAPLEVLFAQKDLNVLGAEPPVPEDGRMGAATRRAVAELQQRFGQEPTGRISAETAAAIRYAAGCIYSQDRAFVA